MNLLIYEWDGYGYAEIREVLTEHGVHVDTIRFESKTTNIYDDFPKVFREKLKENTYDAVFSFNFVHNVAEACYEHNIKYISWTYDSPVNIQGMEHKLGYPTSYSFFFDKLQVKKYKDMGFEHIYHLPLAANTKRLSKIKPDALAKTFYEADISFVGRLYESRFPHIWKELSPYMQGYLKAAVLSQEKLYGCNIYEELITDEILTRINLDYTKGHRTNYLSKAQVTFQMNTYTTNQERKLLLAALSEIGTTKFYSTDRIDVLKNVVQMGPVTYRDRMPLVFKLSKINLNISLKCIYSGIPLRAIDILGSGGFLLSNYQPELAEFFIPDEELVLYTGIDDAVEKAKFYLAHDTLRQQIAQKGFERINKDFTFETQLTKIFKICDLV